MTRRIVFAGDSIVHGGPWQDWLPGHTVTNFAFPGHTTSDLVALVDSIVDAQPELLIVMIGTNDFGKYRLTDEEVIKNVMDVAKTLRARIPGIPIVWNSLSPRSDEFSESVMAVNAFIKPALEMSDIEYFDAFAILKDPEKNVIERVYCEDPDTFGLHLTQAGYQAWFSALAPVIAQHVRD
jgi:lysophospholipase L1-like esterase